MIGNKMIEGDYFMNARKNIIRAVWEILDFYNKQVEINVMPLADAQIKAIEDLKKLNLSYKKEDYFWINDLGLRRIMHPNTTSNGTNLSDYKDPKLIMKKSVI
jgi:hypothetical protein